MKFPKEKFEAAGWNKRRIEVAEAIWNEADAERMTELRREVAEMSKPELRKSNYRDGREAAIKEVLAILDGPEKMYERFSPPYQVTVEEEATVNLSPDTRKGEQREGKELLDGRLCPPPGNPEEKPVQIMYRLPQWRGGLWSLTIRTEDRRK